MVSYFASGLLKLWIRVEALRTSFKTSIVSMTKRSKICDTLIRLPILAPVLNVNLGYVHMKSLVSVGSHILSVKKIITHVRIFHEAHMSPE